MLRALAALILFFCVQTATGGTISGHIRDASTNDPVPFATVQASGTSYSVSANNEGEYLLRLPPGSYELKFSHVAHYSEVAMVEVDDSEISLDVQLQPALIEVSPIKVYDRQYDAAQRIIVEAIARKEQLLSHIQRYSFDAYTKLSARDTAKVDSNSYFLIAESQVTAYWQYPDEHKEIIKARKQSANLPAEGNLMTVGEILNFNENRIDFGPYAVVSPTATDALDYYEYYLLDTTYVDSQAIFVLEIEPKNDIDPLFVGTVKIADSSYAVVGVDLTVSEGFDSKIVFDPTYRQVYTEFDSKYWMPTLIQFTAVFNISFPGIPVLAVDYQASLHNYDFQSIIEDTIFNEYTLEVDKAADDVDSIQWVAGRLMPLTDLEKRGYFYIDSTEHNKPWHKKLATLSLGALAVAFGAQDFFHFNRVEGAYLGAGLRFNGIDDRVDLRFKSGYAFDARIWQHEYGFKYLFDKRRKISAGVIYRDEVRTRPTIFATPNGNATFMALLDKTDSYDYYREKGYSVAVGTKLWDKTRLTLSYNDFDHRSIQNNTEYSLFRISKEHRPNPAIVEGDLRSLEASFEYDSRQLFRSKGRDRKLESPSYTRFKLGAEYASSNLIDNDFDFTRYYASLRHTWRTFGWGRSALYLYAGASDRDLPPQKYFVVDFDAGLTERRLFMHTLSENNFGGSRVFAAYTSHYFGRKLFQKTGLPLIKSIPLSLGIYGGVFWADFKGNPHHPGDEDIRIAPTPYGEIGFSLGRFIPWGFFSGFALDFTWQLSAYNSDDGAEKFNFGISHEWFAY
ncbi:MAG: carboxypeptidase-like regulatory domain-containing protein [Candidatus Zixiibacteriota bacterium]|nr:MAG: carboxypeptidase-like regulatory domain-containing protein [candidate division Zixibacteria bacterium]